MLGRYLLLQLQLRPRPDHSTAGWGLGSGDRVCIPCSVAILVAVLLHEDTEVHRGHHVRCRMHQVVCLLQVHVLPARGLVVYCLLHVLCVDTLHICKVMEPGLE
jgi:hypothetical protein